MPVIKGASKNYRMVKLFFLHTASCLLHPFTREPQIKE